MRMAMIGVLVFLGCGGADEGGFASGPISFQEGPSEFTITTDGKNALMAFVGATRSKYGKGQFLNEGFTFEPSAATLSLDWAKTSLPTWGDVVGASGVTATIRSRISPATAQLGSAPLKAGRGDVAIAIATPTHGLEPLEGDVMVGEIAVSVGGIIAKPLTPRPPLFLSIVLRAEQY